MPHSIPTRARLGMLTPSSNTILEPVTAAMLADVPGVTAHFSRFPVTEIALSPAALGQFDDAPILRAAELLAHARVDVIAWNGTSAAWIGFDSDERLCERITAATGLPARTTVLAYRALFRRLGVGRVGLVDALHGGRADAYPGELGRLGLRVPGGAAPRAVRQLLVRRGRARNDRGPGAGGGGGGMRRGGGGLHQHGRRPPSPRRWRRNWACRCWTRWR